MTTHENGRVPLEKLRIANPCPARWEEMEGDERVRFCGACKKNVYNLSALPRSEAEALVARNEGQMCAALFRRADGTVLTSDCPVGYRRARARFLRRISMAAAALMGLLGCQFFMERHRESNLIGEVTEPARPAPEVQTELHLTPEEEEDLERLRSLGYITPDEWSADQTPPPNP